MVSTAGCFVGVHEDVWELERELEREVEDDEADVEIKGGSLVRMPRPWGSDEANLRRLLANS